MPDSPSNEDLAHRLAIRDRQISAVHTIVERLSVSLNLDERLKAILAVSMDAVNAQAGTIYLYRPKEDCLEFSYVFGEKAAELLGKTIPASQGVVGSVFRSGVGQITRRDAPTDIDRQTGYRTETILTAPVRYRAGQPIGAMQLLNKRDGDFDASDLEVLEIIASIAATAIEHAQLTREAQVAAVAHAVGDLSHDIKNKITPISMAVYTLRPTVEAMLADLDTLCQQLTPDQRDALQAAVRWVREDYQEQFDIIEEQVRAVQEYTKRIADALKGTITEPALTLQPLRPVLEEQVRQLEPVARARNVRLVAEIAAAPTCRFDLFFLKSAVYNLINNAIPETPPGGSVTLRASARETGAFPDGGYVLIEVEDTGRGMPPHVLESILRGDPRTTKPNGTGLGTKIVFNAVAAHKGRFEGRSVEGEGTTFAMRLPLITNGSR
jgi:signal transduction histidine kinase